MLFQRLLHLRGFAARVSAFTLSALVITTWKVTADRSSKLHDLFIDRFDPVPRVDQHEGAAQGLAALQVLLQQPLPFGSTMATGASA